MSTNYWGITPAQVLQFINLKVNTASFASHLFGFLSNSDSWQCGSSQSRGELLGMLVPLALAPINSLRLSTLFSWALPVNFLSASFSLFLSRCLRPLVFSSCCFAWDGGAPWGPKYIFSSFVYKREFTYKKMNTNVPVVHKGQALLYREHRADKNLPDTYLWEKIRKVFHNIPVQVQGLSFQGY